jgi:peptidyl-prolyl cis-trans isomerase SurA
VRAKFICRIRCVLIALAVISLSVPFSRAQESEARVIDEAVVQVDNDVITLSMVKREMKEGVLALIQQGQSEADATAEISRRRPELIANLINEQLLLQQGKELGLAKEVEDEVNRRMLEVSKGQGIKTIEELRKAMKEGGFDYDTVRQTMRTEMMKQAVLSRDVDAKIFYGASNDEVKKYYEAHKDKFKKPESVTLSEIYLSLAGRSEAEVKAKAEQLITQARGGADFGALAAANSERQQDGRLIGPETKGAVGTFQLPDLRENIAEAIKNVKAGGVSEPVRYDEGFQILRVDARIPGSDVPTFNDTRAREMITAERAESARKEYMVKLRKAAVIRIAEGYRVELQPFLDLPVKPASSSTTSSPTPAVSAEKKSDKKGNKP